MTSRPLVRTVLLTTSYPQSPGDPSGHFVQAEALDLAQQGQEVHVIAPGSGAPRIDWSTNLFIREAGDGGAAGGRGVTVWGVGGGELFGFPGALARAKENPLRILRLSEFVRAVRRRLVALGPIDRIVAHFIVPCGYPLALGASGEIEIVLHGSDVGVVCSLPSLVRTHIVRRLLAREAQFRFVSNSLRTKLLGKLALPEREGLEARSRVEPARITVHRPKEADTRRCRIILAGDDPRDGERETVTAPRANRPRWVVCARLIPSKRVDLAILEAARQGAQLTVIGDGPLRGALEKLAHANAPRARFLGQLPRHEALAFIGSADKLIHTSEAEGAPTVIREARALGTAVLATPSGDVARWAETDPGIALLAQP